MLCRVSHALFFVAAAFSLLFQPGANADQGWMSGADIKSTFDGQEIDGHYSNGRTFSESYYQDGSVSYREADRQNHGIWSVREGTLCTIYDGDTTGGCFRVRRSGSNCFEFYFVARTEEQAERKDFGTPAWTARGWLIDSSSTCPDESLALF